MQRKQVDDFDGELVKQQIIAALERRRDAARAGVHPRPLPALVIARAFGVRAGGSDDSRKRGVRLLIDDLRSAGKPIVADFSGYWLAATAADHLVYQEFRRRMGLHHLVDASADAKSDAFADAAGQLALF